MYVDVQYLDYISTASTAQHGTAQHPRAGLLFKLVLGDYSLSFRTSQT